MRNLVTYKAGALLSGMDYVPKCEFVDVYFNGEYNGIYILIERPGIESTKIDIDEADESDITGGYFIEKDIAMKVDLHGICGSTVRIGRIRRRIISCLNSRNPLHPNSRRECLNTLRNT